MLDGIRMNSQRRKIVSKKYLLKKCCKKREQIVCCDDVTTPARKYVDLRFLFVLAFKHKKIHEFCKNSKK